MSKAKKIIFWVFVGLICAAFVAGIVYTIMPDNVEPETIETTIDSTTVDSTLTVCDTLVIDSIKVVK